MPLRKICATRIFLVAHRGAIWRAPQQLAPKGERMWRIGAPLILPLRRSVAQPAASGATTADASCTRAGLVSEHDEQSSHARWR